MNVSYSINDQGEIVVKKYSWYPSNGRIVVPSKVDNKEVTGLQQQCFDEIKTHVYSVELPECISEIGDYAFEDLTNLAVVIINNENAVVGMDAFSGCTNLQQIVVKSKSVQIYGSVLKDEFSNLKIVYGLTQYDPTDYPGSIE